MTQPSSIYLEELSWSEVKEAMEDGYLTVVFSVGSVEQHGPALPLGTDALIGDQFALEVAHRLPKALVGPTVRLGNAKHHMSFPGTITMRVETLKAVVSDYCRSLASHGFKNLVILVTHGGNRKSCREAVEELRAETPSCKIFLLDRMGKYSSKELFGDESDPYDTGAHGGVSTVAAVVAVRPDLYKFKRAVREVCKIPDPEEFQRVLEDKGFQEFAKSGCLGDGTKADVAYGLKYYDYIATRIADDIRDRLA